MAALRAAPPSRWPRLLLPLLLPPLLLLLPAPSDGELGRPRPGGGEPSPGKGEKGVNAREGRT